MRASHPNRQIAFWVQRAAASVAAARGDEADVDARIRQAISATDYETTARVLRIIARDLQPATPVDLDALDGRLQRLADADTDTDAGAEPGAEATDTPTSPKNRAPRPTGLWRDMIPKRR